MTNTTLVPWMVRKTIICILIISIINVINTVTVIALCKALWKNLKIETQMTTVVNGTIVNY